MESARDLQPILWGKVNQFSKVKNSLREVVSDKFETYGLAYQRCESQAFSGAV